MIHGSIVKASVDAADIVFDASADPNTSDMLSLARICPLEKRVSATVLYSPVDTGRNIAQALQMRSGGTIYITGNSMKSFNEFEITENEIVEWIVAVLKVMIDRGVKISSILADERPGMGSAALKAAEILGIKVGEVQKLAA